MHGLVTKIFTRYPRKTHRALEIIPPLTAIFLISMPFWGAIFFPVWLAYFIIFFDVYWLYNSVNLAICAFIGARKIRAAEKMDWLANATEQENYKKMKHIVIIPTYQESITKIKETIQSIANQTFPARNILVFIAFEEREESAKEKAAEIDREFKNVFGYLYSTFHPDIPISNTFKKLE